MNTDLFRLLLASFVAANLSLLLPANYVAQASATWSRDAKGLTVKLPAEAPADFAYVLKITKIVEQLSQLFAAPRAMSVSLDGGSRATGSSNTA